MDDNLSDEHHIVRTSRRLCPHCNQSVSFKTFKAHRRRYYDPASDRWLGNAEDDFTVFSSTEKPADNDGPPISFGENSMDLDSNDAAPSHRYYIHDPTGE